MENPRCKHDWKPSKKQYDTSFYCVKCGAHGREWLRWNPKKEINEKRIRKCL